MKKVRKAPAAPVDHWDDAVTPADMKEVRRVVIEKAREGNMQAAAIAERTWRRRRRGHFVRIDLPPVDDPSGLAAAQVAVIAAAARGEITPQEGLAFARMIDCRRQALDLVEYEEQLIDLEKLTEERAQREAEERR